MVCEELRPARAMLQSKTDPRHPIPTPFPAGPSWRHRLGRALLERDWRPLGRGPGGPTLALDLDLAMWRGGGRR